MLIEIPLECLAFLHIQGRNIAFIIGGHQCEQHNMNSSIKNEWWMATIVMARNPKVNGNNCNGNRLGCLAFLNIWGREHSVYYWTLMINNVQISFKCL